MLRACGVSAFCGAILIFACGTATGAITVSGNAGAYGQANSFEFPWSENYGPGYGGTYVSYNGSAIVSGASAWSGVSTTATSDPAYPHEFPYVCRTFSGSGYASAGVSVPSGASAFAVSYVNLEFDSDYIFGISFKTSGLGRIRMTRPDNVVVAECEGDNEIIGFLSAGHYSLQATIDASVTAPPLGWPYSVSASGDFSFTVPGPGNVAAAGLAVLLTAGTRRRGWLA